MTRRDALIGALRALKPRAGPSDETLSQVIAIAADKLSLMAGPHREIAPAAFRDASLGTADEEKKNISHLARELAEQIEAMSKPTVLALAEVGLLRTRLMTVAEDLRDISSAASRAKIDPQRAVERRGRIKKGPIDVIRRITANAYYEITGKEPSGAGEFLKLSRKVITLLELDDKPSGFAKLAYEDFQRRRVVAD